MGYHVAIVRTGPNQAGITHEEIEPVTKRLGYTLELNEAGSIKHAFREVSGEEIVLFYDDKELWAKNPSEVTLDAMLEVARALGAGARVRGDEGETYKTVSKTYDHPDDAQHIVKTSIDWKYWVSWAPPFLAVSFLLYAAGKHAIRYFHSS
jgi:hypothetical protein